MPIDITTNVSLGEAVEKFGSLESTKVPNVLVNKYFKIMAKASLSKRHFCQLGCQMPRGDSIKNCVCGNLQHI